MLAVASELSLRKRHLSMLVGGEPRKEFGVAVRKIALETFPEVDGSLRNAPQQSQGESPREQRQQGACYLADPKLK